jgi:hypothetical protein
MAHIQSKYIMYIYNVIIKLNVTHFTGKWNIVYNKFWKLIYIIYF